MQVGPKLRHNGAIGADRAGGIVDWRGAVDDDADSGAGLSAVNEYSVDHELNVHSLSVKLLSPVAIWIGSFGWLPRFLPWIVKCDKTIQRLSGERVALLDIAGLPNVTLFVVGRKSGLVRSTRLLCAPTDDGWLVAGSYFGDHRTPSWAFNLREVGHAQVGIRAQTFDVGVRELSGDDLPDAWRRLDDVWPNFALYRGRTDRQIPVFSLTRQAPS